jgi:uncharacterized membrane protein
MLISAQKNAWQSAYVEPNMCIFILSFKKRSDPRPYLFNEEVVVSLVLDAVSTHKTVRVKCEVLNKMKATFFF